MLIRCDLDLKKCTVQGGLGIVWENMPSDIVSIAVTTGFGVSVIAGIISGVCYVVSQSLQKKRSQKPGREWHCNICGTYLRSIEGVLEGDRIISCSKCTGRICKNRCSILIESEWVCKICSKTPESWFSSVMKMIQPSKVSFTSQKMETDSMKLLEEDLQAMRDKEKAEIRDFIERLVNAMLGENVDDACVSRLYQDKQYLSVYDRYHQDLSSTLTDLGSALHSSIANLPVTGQSPCTAHSLLKQLIHRLIRDAQNLPSLSKPEIRSPVPSEGSNETYEDLLATAIINKVISSCQNNLPSSSTNSVSSRLSTSSRTRDDKEYYFGEETLDTKWKTTDLDTTSVSSLEEWLHNNETHMGPRQKYVDKVTLTIKQNIEEVAHSDSEVEDVDQEDDKDYFQNNPLINEDDSNWFLQKRQFQGTHSPVPVPMLVPDPTGDAKVLIGDKEVDDTSDLSDIASDYGDTEVTPGVETLLVNSKKVIGGKNMLESLTMGSDGELSADSGVREEKDFDEFGSNNQIDQTIPYVEAVNPSKTDITVDDDNIEDVSIISIYSNTEKDTEYTERYGSLPRRIEKSESMSKYDRKRPQSLIEENIFRKVQSANSQENNKEQCPVEFNGNYSKKEKEKWKNAIKMDNNPYSKENIEKRLNRSSSSVSSLFGTDYYKRQASLPSGLKSKGEEKEKIESWPQSTVDEEDQPKLYQAKPVAIHSDSDDSQIEPQVKPQANNEKIVSDASVSEIPSDSELSYNMYDVSNSQIYKTHGSTLDSFDSNTSIENKLDKSDSIIDIRNNNNIVPVIRPKTLPIQLEIKKTEPPKEEIAIHDINHNLDIQKNKHDNFLQPTQKNKTFLMESPNNTPINESFDAVPTVVRRKKDNTLISKIYRDPNVRKEAMIKRDFTPELAEIPLTPTFRPPLTPGTPITSSPKEGNFRFRTPFVQSLGIKVDDSNEFETQEVQTNVLYSSEDSGDFIHPVRKCVSVDMLNSPPNEDNDSEESNRKGMLHKQMDPIIDELSNKHLVTEQLSKFSKSTPELNSIPGSKFDSSTDTLDTLDDEEPIRISVKELRKRFEKMDGQNKKIVIHSLTARTLRRPRNNFKMT